ncbi:MAG: GTP cyclohydrolase II [Candidatus Nanogingivalis sp.]
MSRVVLYSDNIENIAIENRLISSTPISEIISPQKGDSIIIDIAKGYSTSLIKKILTPKAYLNTESIFFIDSRKDTASIEASYKLRKNRKIYTEYAIRSKANLKTKFGNFEIITFGSRLDNSECVVLKTSDLSTNPLCRIHSSCITGDILGSKHCDCGEQLEASLKAISRSNDGLLIYLFQEGRGIGLSNKLKAYELQSNGLDTVDANRHMLLPDDMRKYTAVRDILITLDIDSIILLTNNPDKINKLEEEGVVISSTVNLKIPANKINHTYLSTKKERMNHSL